MKAFVGEDFLLETELARELYHEVARALPVIDYHSHLSPREVAQNQRYETLTQLWLAGDHYKWRAMRANGVAERYCTGSASDWEKFEAWARTVPKTLRNPLYHWTHMELAFPFGIRDRLLDEQSAPAIYRECNARLGEESFRALGLLRQYRVEVVCTTDDPIDSLEHHLAHARGASGCRLLPTWRPDRALGIDEPASFNAWLTALEEAADASVGSYRGFMVALEKRHSFFHEVGCRLSDHGLERMYSKPCSVGEAETVFSQARRGRVPTRKQVEGFRALVLCDLARLDHARGWVQQFHIGALRNTNTRLLQALGPNTGFDSIGDAPVARDLARFLDRLDSTEQLAKTILYNLNPRDNEVFATMIGNFQDGTAPGKMQYGSAWWFLDQLDGMEKQLNSLSNMGLLSRFVGMLTDSRSLLSFSRHDYFRRLLCNLLGKDVARGHLPNDRRLLSELVQRVCYDNAREYFGFFDEAPAARP